MRSFFAFSRRLRVDHGEVTMLLPNHDGLYDLLRRLLKERVMPDTPTNVPVEEHQQMVREIGLPLKLSVWGAWIDTQIFNQLTLNPHTQPLPQHEVTFSETECYYFARTQTGAITQGVYLALKRGVFQKWVDNNARHCSVPSGLVFLLGAAYTNLMAKAIRAHR